MNRTRKTLFAMAITTALVTVGCGGRNDGPVAVVQDPTAAPQSAGSSGTAFINFIKGLKPNDETSEPLTFNDNFAVPPDDTGEPDSLA